ncbi:hypothetical protein, partial [Pseudomonas inefficax]|uniref:hypothetical protein n=1 Tax=Pseudomonas inefficax TaxID=2078786 RepID=UPI0019609B33
MDRHRKWTMPDIKTSTFPLFALCSLLFALCSLLFALCSLLFALCSLLSSVGINNKVNIHFRRWRLVTFPPLRRVTFCQTRQKVTKKRWRYDSPTWVTNQFT